MTRRDFELIAAVIRDAHLTVHGQRVTLASDMANALECTNPAFDRARFLRACMPSWVPGTRHESRWDRAVETRR